jgi:hypothetical protein
MKKDFTIYTQKQNDEQKTIEKIKFIKYQL